MVDCRINDDNERLRPARGTCPGAVGRRHVLYVEGYDPMGAQWYYQLFQGTCERCRRLWPLTLKLHPLAVDSTDFAHWRLDLRGPRWQVATRYDFLRMENFIRADIDQGSLRQLGRGLHWCLADALNGVPYRILRGAGWRFAVHLLWFQLLLLAWAAAAGGIGLAELQALRHWLGLPAPAALGCGLASAFVALLALRPLADRWRVVQICSCWSTLRRFGRGRPTWIDAMVEAGAQQLLAAARTNAVDELVLVGHSTGSVVAAAIAARALQLDPALGTGGPRLALLTLGSVMPAVALHPAARPMRAIVAALAKAGNLTWVDCQSRKDVMCFFNFDPVAGIGVDVGAQRRNPLLWRISFKDMIAPENYRRFRWEHFRAHYQYIMGGERAAPYDYVLLVGGPMPIAQWPTHDRAFMAAMLQGDDAPGAGSVSRHEHRAMSIAP